MNLKISFLSILVVGSSAGAASSGPSICATLDKAIARRTASRKLQKFFDLQWKYTMTQNPEWATDLGYPGQNDRWNDRSLEKIALEAKEDVCQLQILKKIPRKALKGEEGVSWGLAVDKLEKDIESEHFGEKYLVVDQLWGVQIWVPFNIRNMPRANKKDYEDILSRLEKIPVLEEQIEVLLREGLKRKITPVKMFLGRVPAQFDQVLKENPEDSPLYEPFKNITANLSAEEKSVLQKRALEILRTKSYPAFQRLKKFVIEDYTPGARESVSSQDLPDGKAWYAYDVKFHTTTNRTPEELHELGLSEVTRISKLMEQLKEQMKFKGDIKAFNQFLLSDPKFYYTDKEQLLTGYRDIAKRMDAALPTYFKNLPRLSYGVREMAEYQAKDAPGAYYEGGSLEAGRAGYFAANTYDLKARPKWGMEVLTFHESVPGHHLQISLAQELKDLPEFRKNGSYTAFVEGWALYCESLAEDMGFYKDPYSKYGMLSFELWRAVRLVIDTGIHSKGWSRQKAVDYFMDLLPKSRLEAEVEVDRYITWPGQALAYKVGQLKLLELRERARKELGDNFNIREFHDQVLKHGALPMNVLESSINDWIEATKRSKS